MEKKSDIKNRDRYWQGIGRRKTAIAIVRVLEGPGKEKEFTVNLKKISDFFKLKEFLDIAEAPLKSLSEIGLKISAKVKGGGIRGQAEAIRLGLSRALVKFNEELRRELKDLGYLTRDARKVERKKPGLKKARRAPQFSKR